MTQSGKNLIDRVIFFDNPAYSDAKISPDGQWLSFKKPLNGVMNLWIKSIDESFENATPISFEKRRPLGSYFWTYDSQYIVFVQDHDGDENYQIYLLKPFEYPTEEHYKESRTSGGSLAIIYKVSRKTPKILYIGLNDRDPAWHDLYTLDITTGEKTLLFLNDSRYTGWSFDWDENLRFAYSVDQNGSNLIHEYFDGIFRPFLETPMLETTSIVGYSQDNASIYVITNHGQDKNFLELGSIDIATKQYTFIERDPRLKSDIHEVIFSEKEKILLMTSYYYAQSEKYFRDDTFKDHFDYLQSRFDTYDIKILSQNKEENKWIIHVSKDTDPGDVYFYDQTSKKLLYQYTSRPRLKDCSLQPMSVIEYPSSDGLMIQGYLTLPQCRTNTLLPTIVMPHGGPWARDYWGYNAYAQFLANRGYAVLLCNFRGSVGFGKDFLDKGNGQWGAKMQDDITYGVKYLVDNAIADPHKIGIMGGSYGGYATLAGVTFTPQLYRAAISIVGPSSLITLLESIPPYWEAYRKTLYARIADPNTQDGLQYLHDASPLHHIDKIITPLMIVQGANDPRVKKSESDQIVAAMKNSKIPYTYLCADDEGHGFARPINNMAFLADAERFLSEHLGGMYQEEMSDEIKIRLEEIKVK